MTADTEYPVRHAATWNAAADLAMENFSSKFSEGRKAFKDLNFGASADGAAYAQALGVTVLTLLKMLHDRIADIETGHHIAALQDAVVQVEQRLKDVAPMTYRGVFNEGQAYVRGDVVTSGGSMWHCDAARTTEKPGTGKSWTLSVKRGADGRPAGG